MESNINQMGKEYYNEIILPYVVQSTPKSAFMDPFNWFMLIGISMVVIMTGVFLLAEFSWIVLVFFCLSIWFLYHYVQAILNRKIEITEEGVHYQENKRQLFFSWDKVEAIKVEGGMGQITFWENGKLKRIHEFGLPRKERILAREIIIAQANHKQIKLQVL